MGQHFAQSDFTEQQFSEFSARLNQNLTQLQQLLKQPGWGTGPCTVGAELEVYLIDKKGNPSLCNQQVLDQANDPQLTPELNRFNLEYNLSPTSFSGTPFSIIEKQLLTKLSKLKTSAEPFDTDVVAIGILPTLQQHHFGLSSMTDMPRYHALTRKLKELRGGPFQIWINGAEPLMLTADDLTLEGANTSFQFHYRVEPDEYKDTYNAIQLVTPVALALSGNSPFFLGHRLWQETRVALFKQSIDSRNLCKHEWQQPPRVGFGQGWLRSGAYELFLESVKLYPPLLPLIEDENYDQPKLFGRSPSLHELRLHHGTVWSWNRSIYDPADNGHLRIELRALPAGPTPTDMVANAAFIIGMAEGLKSRIDELITEIPFKYAKYNFYRAAQKGMNARLIWPKNDAFGLNESDVTDIAAQLLPVAHKGLVQRGVDEREAARYLSIIEMRLGSKRSGANWQSDYLHKLESELPRQQALTAVLKRYQTLSDGNKPVAEWSLDK